MIYPYVGEFLISPVPLQLSFNWCSHACSYCFANLNSPNRSFDLKEFQSQLKGMYTNNSLPSLLLRKKYPVLISNLVDPFATSNYGVAVPVMEMMTHMEIPIAVQTRGGRGIEDVLSFLPKSVWYVSIPMLDDDIRKKVEPAAPNISSRLELIDNLKAKGHLVVVGMNPTISDWLPDGDGKELIRILKSKDVHGIWINQVHFNQRQLQRMSERDRNNIGEVVLKKGLKNAKTMQPGCYEFASSIKDYALSQGLEVEGLNASHENRFFKVFQETYKNTFPSIYDFVIWCYQNKKDNDPVYYHEFEAMMLEGLPIGKYNISPYMRCMNVKLDDEIRNTDGYKQTFQYLVKMCWNEYRMKRTLDRFHAFAFSMNNRSGNLDFNKDKDGNYIFHFNKNIYDDDFFIYNN